MPLFLSKLEKKQLENVIPIVTPQCEDQTVYSSAITMPPIRSPPSGVSLVPHYELFQLNFWSLKVLSRYRDQQFQVTENYLNLKE